MCNRASRMFSLYNKSNVALIILLTLYDKGDSTFHPKVGRVRNRNVDHHGEVGSPATIRCPENRTGVDTCTWRVDRWD